MMEKQKGRQRRRERNKPGIPSPCLKHSSPAASVQGLTVPFCRRTNYGSPFTQNCFPRLAQVDPGVSPSCPCCAVAARVEGRVFYPHGNTVSFPKVWFCGQPLGIYSPVGKLIKTELQNYYIKDHV